MTDGHASYPGYAVDQIKSSNYISKVEFLGVGFGNPGWGSFGSSVQNT